MSCSVCSSVGYLRNEVDYKELGLRESYEEVKLSILEVLKNSKLPLTGYSVSKKIRKQSSSIKIMMDRMVDEGLIEVVYDDWKKKYMVKNNDSLF